jgi:probable HAF family extracellular repeat protein
MRKSFFALAVSLVCLVPLMVSAQDYKVTKFPTLGGTQTRAFAINQNGDVVGVSGTPTTSHAFLWNRFAGIQDLGTLGGPTSTAMAINDSDQVAGFAEVCACQNKAFWWSAATGMQNIGLPGQLASIASGIDNHNEVVGTFVETNGVSEGGFLWTQPTGMQDLATLGCVDCFPNAINDSSQLVGATLLPDGSQHAFLWSQAQGKRDLGTLGGPNSMARAISASGEVVGQADTSAGVQHAFLWTEATGMQDLGTLSGYVNSSAANIDASGRIVGSSWNPVKKSSRPFIWTQTSGMQLLGPFGTLKGNGADSINTAGQILLSSYVGSGYSSWLLTPLMHTTLTSSPNPSQVGEPVTFTATVSSSVQGPPPDGEIVTFKSGTKIWATIPLQSGVATFTRAFKSTKSIRAVYAGDANYASSHSAPLQQVVVQ